MAWLRLIVRKCLTFLKLPFNSKILLGQAFVALTAHRIVLAF